MQYKQEDLKKLQSMEVEILKEIIRICEEENIEYFLAHGTAIGAVRHNGFIPWDDDIDIGMMRKDYDKFLEVAPQRLAEGYFLQWFGTEPEAPAYFAKVRKNGTLFVEEYAKDIPMHQGIFVDIMPFDLIPQSKMECEIHRITVRVLSELYLSKAVDCVCWRLPPWKTRLVNLERSILHFLLKPVPRAWLFKALDRCLRSYNDSGSTAVSSRAEANIRCDVADLVPTVLHDFEGFEVRIPADVDRVLSIQYGDYMTLPPEEKRESHAPIMLKFHE